MRGLASVTREINKFLKPFECSCRCGTDFCYLYDKSLIYYSFLVVEKANVEFMASIERLNPQVKMDIFLWSLLHELGHHETMDLIDDDEMEEAERIKEEIEVLDIRDTKDYYDCIDERMATEWAVDYANNHAEELEKFWYALQEKILNFYKLNQIEGLQVQPSMV